MNNLEKKAAFLMPIDSPLKFETIYDSFGKFDVKKYIIENFSFISINELSTLDEILNSYDIDLCYWLWMSSSHKAFRIFALHKMVELIKTKEDLLDFMQHFQGRTTQTQSLPLMFYISCRKYEELYKT